LKAWKHVVLAGMLAGASLATASAALADSGSIAGAPVIVAGQQEFGNTMTGGVVGGDDPCYRSYWLLNVTAGDAVTVDWESQESNTILDVFPAGTTDYNVDNTSPLQDQGLNSNDKNELTFTASSTSTLPFSFRSGCDSNPGPYDFTVYLTHAMSVALSPVQAALAGTATIGVHNPDGVPLSGPPIVVTLQVSGAGVPWTTLGSGSPTNGAANVSYTVPAALDGKNAKFRAVGSGAGYATATSASQTVRMPAAPPPPPACVVPRLDGRSLAGAKAALNQAHCALGAVRHHRHVARRYRGRVLRQTVKPGTNLAAGSKVGVTVGVR
jgi:hypothetical protein